MGANEIANRIEAAAWIAAAGQEDGEGFTDVTAEDFFFRSIVGFENRLTLLSPEDGEDWGSVDTISMAIFLERAYSRGDTAIQITPIETMRADASSGDVLPVSYEGVIRVLPLSTAGFAAAQAGDPFTLPGSLDPYSVLLIIINLDQFQVSGVGVEFAINVMRLQEAIGETSVAFEPL